MSTSVMAAVWPLQMDPTAKAVLVSLADNANDNGYCWPSIDTIAERTCFGRTAVLAAIQRLEVAGLVVADRSNGRRSEYQIVIHNQSASRTRPPAEPVRQTDQTSPAGGLNQSARRTLTIKNHQEPSEEKKPRVRAGVDCPEHVKRQTWDDWLEVRRVKKAGPVTVTALEALEREARKCGFSLQSAVQVCAERSWVSLNAGWVQTTPPAQSAADKRAKTLAGLIGQPPGERDAIDSTVVARLG